MEIQTSAKQPRNSCCMQKITTPKQLKAELPQISLNNVLGRLPPELFPLIISYCPSQIGQIKNSYKFKYKFCSSGTGLGQAIRPWGMAINADGQLVVAVYSGGTIQTWDPSGVPISILAKGILDTPMGLALRKNGDILVTEYCRHHVMILSPEGVLLKQIGQKGNGKTEFDYPTDITLDEEEKIYVADSNKLRIFTPKGRFDKEFPIPSLRGVAVYSNGDIALTENTNHRLLILDSQGKQLDSWGSRGSEPGSFDNPLGLKLDVDGNLIVVDHGNNRIQIFDRSGKLLQVFGPDDPGHQLVAPIAAFLDLNGNIFVTDEQDRITVWG